jgi:TPP-dependent pyruvate/acetoin dehydrogenase alpha subunit
MHYLLGELANPEKFHGPISIGEFQPSALRDFIKQMLMIRCAEEQIGKEIISGSVKCPCHLAIGQEAVAVALSPHVHKGDKVFGTHRSHAHYLALGGDLYKLFAEILGKDEGCSRGMGGSMHLIDKANHLYGTVPIVGATIPIATGAGLAAKMSAKQEVSVSFFGDGASEEGVLHESLNLASNMNLPVIFICENNFFSSHLHINLRQPSDSIARFAQAHSIACEIVDGNDVIALHNCYESAFRKCRNGKGPFFIEAVTYRWRGHVGPSEDIDVGVSREDDLGKWKKRDPIARLYDGMVKSGIPNLPDTGQLMEEERVKVQKLWEKALQAPYPPDESLLARVYGSN